MKTSAHSAIQAASRLEQLGFTRRGNLLRGAQLTIQIDPMWTTCTLRMSPDRIVAQLPTQLLDDLCDDEALDGHEPLAEIVDWLKATAAEQVPDGWSSPPLETLIADLPKGALSLQVGQHSRQGELIADGKTLRVRFSIAHAARDSVSEPRRRAINELLREANARFRLVRVHEMPAGEGGFRIVAEADLSGVPHCLLPALLYIAVDAARGVASRLIRTTDLLVDQSVTVTAWDSSPDRAVTHERS